MNHEGLNAIDEAVLLIAAEIGSKKRTIEVEALYRKSISQLSYSNEEILWTIKKLYQKKYLIERSKLTKDTLLNNKTRKQIYNYIKMNPGAHNREIRKVFNIDNYLVFRHLKYLELFELIRSKKFMNKKAYFLRDMDENKDEIILLLKNERRKKIFNIILHSKKVRLSEIEKALSLDHGHIQPHLKILLEYNLIDAKKENEIVHYSPKINTNIV